MSDTCTAQAGEVMHIPTDSQGGRVFGETGSLQGSQKKQTTSSRTALICCLLPCWEALPDSGAVNASALFLHPVSTPDCIFSYISYPDV